MLDYPNSSNMKLMANCPKPTGINVPMWAIRGHRQAVIAAREEELTILPTHKESGEVTYLLVRFRIIEGSTRIDIIGELLPNAAGFVKPF